MNGATIGSGLTPPMRGALLALLAAVVALTWWAYGPHPLDDAFITYRYARNFAEGEGLVFNAGIPVQGFTSPLFTLTLGVLGAVGLPIPATGLALATLAGLGTLLLLIVAGRMAGAEIAGWIAALGLSLQIFWVALLVGGMETTLFSAVALGALLAVATGRWRCVGALVGISCLVRPEGVLVGVVALAMAAWRAGGKAAVREALIAALIFIPWFVFAWLYFGQPIPQSVLAKGLGSQAVPWAEILRHHLLFWSFQPLAFLWLALAIVGAVALARERREWLALPLWIALHLAALIAGRAPVMNFAWYVVPLLPPLFFLGAFGLLAIARWLAGPMSLPASGVAIASALALLAWQAHRLWEWREEFGAQALNREDAYEAAANALRPMLRPGDRVYVGEVGAISWFLPEAHIIDSAGLVSPEVMRLARQVGLMAMASGNSAALTRLIVEEEEPDFISTQRRFLALEEVQREPWFAERYVEIDDPGVQVLDQWAFIRRDHPSAPVP